jgi:hypothetical protein
MPAKDGLPDHSGMDPLSLVPVFAWLILLVLLGLGFRWLAGDEADDAGPILSALLTTEWPDHAGPGIREPEFVPFRFDAPRVPETRRAPGRTQPKVRLTSPV